jgi:hypothetical protein
MKGTIKVLDAKGHTAVEFDTDTGVVEEAEQILRHAVAAGSALFSGTTKERIPFSKKTPAQERGAVLEQHEEILVVPPMAGGS